MFALARTRHFTCLRYKSNIINKYNINNSISCISFIKCTIWRNNSFFHDINMFCCFSYLLSPTNVQIDINFDQSSKILLFMIFADINNRIVSRKWYPVAKSATPLRRLSSVNVGIFNCKTASFWLFAVSPPEINQLISSCTFVEFLIFSQIFSIFSSNGMLTEWRKFVSMGISW